MARVQLDMIKNFTFKTELSIRITDINYGNHVGHDSFISLLHEARLRFLHNIGFSEANIDGKALILSDLVVSYESQAFYGDKLLFEIGAGEFNKYGCDIFYRVSNKKSKKLVLLAKTGIVFFDYSENKITTMPGIFSRVLNPFSVNTKVG